MQKLAPSMQAACLTVASSLLMTSRSAAVSALTLGLMSTRTEDFVHALQASLPTHVPHYSIFCGQRKQTAASILTVCPLPHEQVGIEWRLT